MLTMIVMTMLLVITKVHVTKHIQFSCALNNYITSRYGRTHLSCLWKIITNNTMRLSDSEVAFMAIISTFIILSFLSNVCVVVVLVKMTRTVTNMFLTNLAVSNMILVSVVLPLQVHDISHANEYCRDTFQDHRRPSL